MDGKFCWKTVILTTAEPVAASLSLDNPGWLLYHHLIVVLCQTLTSIEHLGFPFIPQGNGAGVQDPSACSNIHDVAPSLADMRRAAANVKDEIQQGSIVLEGNLLLYHEPGIALNLTCCLTGRRLHLTNYFLNVTGDQEDCNKYRWFIITQSAR